jgi:signal transduction histidine kinase
MPKEPEPQSKAESAEESAERARADLAALMEALREANGHLIVANLRSEALAEQMTQLYLEASIAIQAKDDFFALISHELRTPLTSITGWAGLLGGEPDSATVAEAAHSIATSAAVQAKLVDDLLDVSRIMTGKFDISRAEIDLYTVVNDAVSAMRPAAAAKGVSLQTSANESIVISGDARRLGQVVSNLLSNALKFTPAGGIIDLRLTALSTLAVLEVQDNGEGIPVEFLLSIFERRAQSIARRFAGLGLGLTIVKHIVELHDGSVKAESEGEGKGARFTITIPRLSRLTGDSG